MEPLYSRELEKQLDASWADSFINIVKEAGSSALSLADSYGFKVPGTDEPQKLRDQAKSYRSQAVRVQGDLSKNIPRFAGVGMDTRPAIAAGNAFLAQVGTLSSLYDQAAAKAQQTVDAVARLSAAEVARIAGESTALVAKIAAKKAVVDQLFRNYEENYRTLSSGADDFEGWFAGTKRVLTETGSDVSKGVTTAAKNVAPVIPYLPYIIGGFVLLYFVGPMLGSYAGSRSRR